MRALLILIKCTKDQTGLQVKTPNCRTYLINCFHAVKYNECEPSRSAGVGISLDVYAFDISVFTEVLSQLLCKKNAHSVPYISRLPTVLITRPINETFYLITNCIFHWRPSFNNYFLNSHKNICKTSTVPQNHPMPVKVFPKFHIHIILLQVCSIFASENQSGVSIRKNYRI